MYSRSRIPHLAASMIAFCVLLAACTSASAARLLHLEIYVDDQLALTAIGGDSGREDGSEIWSRLDQIDWEPAEGFALPISEEDPSRVSLSGRVVIQVKHTEHVLAQSTVSELMLVRAPDGKNQWQMPPGEVTRTGIAAGLPGNPPTPQAVAGQISRKLGLLALIALAIVFIAVVAIVAIALASRRDSSPEQ